MTPAYVAEPMIDTLIGHEVKGSTGAKTYTHREVESLKAAMDALDYLGLRLPRVFSPLASMTCDRRPLFEPLRSKS